MDEVEQNIVISLWRADLRDTDKSWYFVITEFNNCWSFDQRVCFFLMNILRKQSDLPFLRKSDHKKEKGRVSFTHVLNIICSQRQMDGIVHEQTIICRQLFAGHVVGSRPMKRKKNLLRMIMKVIILVQGFYPQKINFLMDVVLNNELIMISILVFADTTR